MKAIQGEVLQDNENMQNQLAFTGNWFIDAGILGFVNLMEEVYGWDLNELQNRINKEPEKVYYGYFPFAYLYKLLGRTQEVNPELIKKLDKELKDKIFKNSQELFDFMWFSFICALFKDAWVKNKLELIYKDHAYNKNKKLKKQFNYKNTQVYLQKIGEREKLIITILNEHRDEIKEILKSKKELKKFEYENLEKLVNYDGDVSKELKRSIELLKEKHYDIMNFLEDEWENNVVKQQKLTKKESLFYRIPIDNSFYKNFLFFHLNKGNLEQKSSFYNMICFNPNEEEMLKRIDKTVNKFLLSEEKFSNVNYTKLSTEPLKKQFDYLFVYLICFIYAFENYRNIGNVFFYSNDLEFSYRINNRVKVYKKKLEDKRDSNLIFRITWQQIINSLVEHKSSWSLENMYIISYQKLDNKTQENIKYIGIPKLQASIIIDDTIRENLNNGIQFRNNNFENRFCWLLEEFIKGKPLYPIILNHVNLVINNETNLSYRTAIYSLITEANILYFRSENEKPNSSIFSENYFNNYKGLVQDIKEDVRRTSYCASLIKKISNDENKKARIARELISALKAKDKNLFLNILLKNLNENKELTANDNFNRWLMEKIVENDVCFEIYGLILVMNLIGGRKNE